MLLPQGLATNPYEVLDYQSVLTLEDAEGVRARVRRSEQIRFLQDGVSGILDHTWGDGVVLTYYHNDAGRLEDSFRDQGRHHLVIGLKRPMGRGETLVFGAERLAIAGFTNEEEWLETRIDHRADHLARSIVFPKERPCLRASLHYEGLETALRIVKLADKRTVVGFDVRQPMVDTPYTIRWLW